MTKFEKKVRSLKISEIIFYMIEALENPITIIDMATFGRVKRGLCFGCAATNTICRIGNFNTTDLVNSAPLNGIINRELLVQEEPINTFSFVEEFELAIDSLRSGYLYAVNGHLENIRLNKIPEEFLEVYLPALGNEYTKTLLAYKEFANKLKTEGY